MVHKRFVRGSFVTADKVLNDVLGKRIRHLQNEVGGAIVNLGLFFILNLIGNGFVRSITSVSYTHLTLPTKRIV